MSGPEVVCSVKEGNKKAFYDAQKAERERLIEVLKKAKESDDKKTLLSTLRGVGFSFEASFEDQELREIKDVIDRAIIQLQKYSANVIVVVDFTKKEIEKKLVEPGKRLRQARIIAGYSQAELSRLVGNRQPVLSEHETGKRKNMSRKTVDKYAKHLDVDGSWIMYGVGKGPESLGAKIPEANLDKD